MNCYKLFTCLTKTVNDVFTLKYLLRTICYITLLLFTKGRKKTSLKLYKTLQMCLHEVLRSGYTVKLFPS